MEQPLATMALARVGKCCRSLLLESSKFCGSVQPAWIESCIGGKASKWFLRCVMVDRNMQQKTLRSHIVRNPHGNSYCDDVLPYIALTCRLVSIKVFPL